MSSSVTRIWMWSEACARLDRAEHLQRSFFRPREEGVGGPVWEPPADIFESATELHVTIALPGVAPEQLDIFQREDGVVVTADRRLPRSGSDLAIRCLEIPYGRFERRLPLPRERAELVERTLANGCLLLRFRKRI